MYSNLTGLNFEEGNHIVTAVTEDSVNSEIKKQLDNVFRRNGEKNYNYYFISDIDKNNNTIYFEVDEDTKNEDIPKEFETLLENLKNETRSLFDIFEETNIFDENCPKSDIGELYDSYFLTFAYQLKSGYPAQFCDSNGNLNYRSDAYMAYKPISLISPSEQIEANGAKYTHYFKDITIVQISESHRNVSVNYKKQSDPANNELWGFVYNVNFNSDFDYDYLSPYTKDVIRNHFNNPSDEAIKNMFEISQLFLDFATLTDFNTSYIEGLNVQASVNLSKVVKKYLKDVYSDKNRLGTGDCILTVKDTDKKTEYLFKPCSYIYSVTKDSNGLKTLNYVMSTSDNKPNPLNYKWDFLSKDDVGKFHGLTAVHRDVLFEKFNDRFAKEILPSIRKRFVAKVENNRKFFDKPDLLFDVENSTQGADQAFEYKGKNRYEYPCFKEESKSEKNFEVFPPYTAQHEITYSFSCCSYENTIFVNGVVVPAITYNTHVCLHEWCKISGSVSEGNIYDSDIYCNIGILMDNNANSGQIILNLSTNENNKDCSMDTNKFLSAITSMGVGMNQVNDISNELKKNINQMIEQFTSRFDNWDIKNISWVIPGEKTFCFSNQQFCETGDFQIGVTYSQI